LSRLRSTRSAGDDLSSRRRTSLVKRAVFVAIAVCAFAAPAWAGSTTFHRAVLHRSWTPAVLTKTVHRLAHDRGLSLAVLSGRGRYGNKGWWLVWSAPRRASQEQMLRDEWATTIASRLYQARRKSSAPKLRAVLTRAEWAHGDRTGSWSPPLRRIYVQARSGALRARVARRAATLGLEIRAFRVPRLDGILVPVVTLQVRNRARFKRRYELACAEAWMFGPRRCTGSPYFGYFLTVADSAGVWLYSTAVEPNGTTGASSARVTKLLPPPTSSNHGGLETCSARLHS
jgi:hypothetical protein